MGIEAKRHACEIRALTFCAGLKADEIATLSAISTRLHITKRQIIFQEGAAAEYVYNVTQGAVRLYKLTPDGRRQITGFLLPGDFLGLTFETVSRNISQLKRDGLIRQYSVHEFELPRIEELRDLSEPV